MPDFPTCYSCSCIITDIAFKILRTLMSVYSVTVLARGSRIMFLHCIRFFFIFIFAVYEFNLSRRVAKVDKKAIGAVYIYNLTYLIKQSLSKQIYRSVFTLKCKHRSTTLRTALKNTFFSV